MSFPRCFSSRRSRAATSTSCAPRPSRARPSCSGASSPRGSIFLLALPFGIEVASGPLGFVLFKTRSAAATQSGSMVFFPLLILTPSFVPRDLLTRPMEVAASLNPVTHLMESLRSLILEDLAWSNVLPGFGVVFVFGALMLALNERMINSYD